jgi:hypothetical protein
MGIDYSKTAEELRAILDRAVTEVRPEDLRSPVLQKLIADVKACSTGSCACPDDQHVVDNYNRFHNRHNRDSSKGRTQKAPLP